MSAYTTDKKNENTDIRPKILEILKDTISYKDENKKKGLIDIVHYVTKNPKKAARDIINLLKFKNDKLELNEENFVYLFKFLDECEDKYIGVTNSMKIIYDRIDKEITKLEERLKSESKSKI